MNPLKFLIVEDDFYIARNLKKQLLKIGYQVTAVAGSTISAITAFNKEKPDLVIMDIELPDSEEAGIELAIIFKDKNPNLPIVFYTSHIEESELMRKAIATSPDAILSKKSSLQELLININNAIQKRINDLISDAASEVEIRKDSDSFWIKSGSIYERYFFDSVCWIQSKDKGVYIFTDTGGAIFSSTLKYFENQIGKNILQRTSQSHLINLNKAFDLNRLERTIKVKVANKKPEIIPISDKYLNSLLTSLNIIKTR